jgi:hypothetical protein
MQTAGLSFLYRDAFMKWVWCVLRVIERFSGRSGRRSRISGRFSTLFIFFMCKFCSFFLVVFFFFLFFYLEGAVTAPRDVEGSSIMGVVVYIIISLAIDDDTVVSFAVPFAVSFAVRRDSSTSQPADLFFLFGTIFRLEYDSILTTAAVHMCHTPRGSSKKTA